MFDLLKINEKYHKKYKYTRFVFRDRNQINEYSRFLSPYICAKAEQSYGFTAHDGIYIFLYKPTINLPPSIHYVILEDEEILY